MHLQDIIASLNDFWRGEGCALLQPYDLMMGAATFHPATALRALGRKAWRAAYVQGCRRPTDGRYGENPNRLQHYYQYQVVIKPSPRELQETYLESLAQLGIERDGHDIVFVEDDWESPTLGATGLGWEVRCDGMEITQMTYFQQMGGWECYPVTAEVTYGLERLALFLQKKSSVFDLQWNENLTYGDLFAQSEKEGSDYNFRYSNPERLLIAFEEHKKQCEDLLNNEKHDSLVLPAWECCVQASHVFNLLDARGAIAVGERPNYINRIRRLAHEVTKAWREQQEKMT